MFVFLIELQFKELRFNKRMHSSGSSSENHAATSQIVNFLKTIRH